MTILSSIRNYISSRSTTEKIVGTIAAGLSAVGVRLAFLETNPLMYELLFDSTTAAAEASKADSEVDAAYLTQLADAHAYNIQAKLDLPKLREDLANITRGYDQRGIEIQTLTAQLGEAEETIAGSCADLDDALQGAADDLDPYETRSAALEGSVKGTYWYDTLQGARPAFLTALLDGLANGAFGPDQKGAAVTLDGVASKYVSKIARADRWEFDPFEEGGVTYQATVLTGKPASDAVILRTEK